MVADRIHILGASGSGTTTLGRALAARLGYDFFDTDAFYWEPSEPPFSRKREVAARLALLEPALDRSPRWVLSGSLCSWGDSLLPRFEQVVFLSLNDAVRLARLLERERVRYTGARIAPGGDRYEQHTAFMAWASLYESGDARGRSRWMHEAWLKRLPPACAVTRLDSAAPVAALVELLVRQEPAASTDATIGSVRATSTA